MHAQISIGDSHIMLVDDFPDAGCFGPKHYKGTPVTLHIYVEDVDAAYKRAIDAGAHRQNAAGRHVLGRPLRRAGRPIRP